MKTKNEATRPEISFEVADCLKMKSIDSKSFDLVIDKATFDVLLTYENPYLTVSRYLREIQRVLRLGGNFVLITTGSPDTRMFHLTREHLKFEIRHMEVQRKTDDCVVTHYVYICTKGTGTD